MKVNQLFGLVGKIGLKFDAYSSFRPTPLNLRNLLEFGLFAFNSSNFITTGRTAPASKSFEFLKNELPVRIANILQEIRLLPDSLLLTKPLQEIIKMLFALQFVNYFNLGMKIPLLRS